MHKLYYTLCLLFLAAAQTGCSKSFLDLSPESETNAGNFYKTAAQMEQAVIAAYDALQSNGQYGRNFTYFMEVSADNSMMESLTGNGGIYGDFERWNVTPSNILLQESWQACYAGIQRCNIVLNRINGVVMPDTIKAIRSGEVKFIRALTYFNMVRIWRKLPLVITEVEDPFETFRYGRETTETIYNQIIKDLEEAATALPPTVLAKDAGRVTRGAAQALLGKVFLTLHDYKNAARVLQQVINDKQYGLLNNFADVFAVTNKNNRESIFEVQFIKGGFKEGSSYSNLYAPLGDVVLNEGVGPSGGENIPTRNLLQSYAATDKRKSATIDSTAPGRLYTRKFRDKPVTAYDAGNNFMVLRYADVLLMCAEALNADQYIAKGLALDYLNEVRQRTGLALYKETDLNTQSAFALAIEQERRYELAFEHHRWFDLLRTNRALEILNQPGAPGTLQEHQLLFPIPQQEINTNPDLIKQNPFYE